ncbi:hypothetical protein BJX96DRAFT_161110 [Aspergillus floccosus]
MAAEYTRSPQGCEFQRGPTGLQPMVRTRPIEPVTHASSRQRALDGAGQQGSEECTTLSRDIDRDIEGLLALVTPCQSLRQPEKRRHLK